MKRFYFTGQRSFGNRGCEAIVRSSVELLKEKFGEIEAWVPSDNISYDSGQWPEAMALGVRFVPAYNPSITRYWLNLQRLPFRFLKTAGWPFPISRDVRERIDRVDAVVAVGGDNYSLDYRLPSFYLGVDSMAMDLQKPLILWGASVGPFEAEPHFIPIIREHLARMSLIVVRESDSESYLRGTLGLDNVIRCADPAFTLKPQSVEIDHYWPHELGNGVLGLNISPLLTRYRNSGDDLRDHVANFIEYAVEKANLSVVLVPHVIPIKGSEKDSDAVYMRDLLKKLRSLGKRLTMVDSRLNAAQLKHVIGRCRYFIGARTHATIAALSSGVPTVSIAYSVKAKGINKDIFGHLDYVLETPTLGAASLISKLNELISQEQAIIRQLNEKMTDICRLSERAAEQMAALF